MADAWQLINDAFEPLVSKASGDPRALLKLSELAISRNNQSRALEIAAQARALASGDGELTSWANDIIAATVPAFHVPMLRDHLRNRAFKDAIDRAVRPGMRVLDVGSGSGLLAMMAAEAGACQVYSCEVNLEIAAVARDIVALNGFSDRIQIFAKLSNDLDVSADLGGQVDLVIAEIVGKELVDELVLPSARDVAQRLLKPGGRMIPERGDVRIALAWLDDLPERNFGQECGFDMEPFNRLLPSRFEVRCGDMRLHLRGEAASLFSFDFTSTQEPPSTAEIDLYAEGGPVNGVVQWIGLKMDDHEYFENRPQAGQDSHWVSQFLPLSSVIEDVKGKTVRIAGAHSHGKLRFWEVK